MKKVFAFALVLAMAATLFVAAPVNAATSVTNYMAATEESATTILPEVWNWGKSATTLYYWTNAAAPVLSFKSYNLGTPITFGGNTIAGNRIFEVTNKNYADQYAILFTSKGLAAGNYTFFYWMKGTGVTSDAAGTPMDVPNAGFYGLNITCNGTSLTTAGAQSNGWWITYPTIDAANADADLDGATGTMGLNGVNSNNFDWTLVRTRFTVSADQANIPLKIELTLIGGANGFAAFDIDGMGLVSGSNVPSFADFYYEDLDRDGIKNINDTDLDGDGIANINDADANADGVDDATDVDVDKDGIINKYDPDIDGDGIKNVFDKDMDGDYILNIYDRSPMGCLSNEMPK